jgi:hypothetical protein
MSFYDDMTYRCEHWHPGDYSKFKFVDNDVMFQHSSPYSSSWTRFSEDSKINKHQLIRDAYNNAINRLIEEAMKLETI